MKTHPDAVGSDRLVDKYIEYRNQYEAARAVIERAKETQESAIAEDSKGYRLLFYREFHSLERIDKPYAFNKYYHTRREIELTKQRAFEFFSNWRRDYVELYEQASKSYDRIKQEKPRGPYRRHALLYNLSPVFHNITSYQLTGLDFYKKQLRQNLGAIMHQLDAREFYQLAEYIRFLMEDMECGPAIYE